MSAHIGWDDKGTHLLRVSLAGRGHCAPPGRPPQAISLGSRPVTTDSVSYDLRDRVAVLAIDDGKANALSFEVIAALGEGLDRAEADGAGAVLLTGRSGMFSGGFDLAVMRGGDAKATLGLVTKGAELVHRLYGSPRPIVAACTGHAIAAGAFVLMGSHFRIGADGAFRLCLIETQIGMVLPDWAIEITKERLVGPHIQQAAIESRVYDPVAAVEAGFLDKVVPEDEVLDAALAEANRLAALPASAYAGNAAKVRAVGLERLAAAIARDQEAVAALG